MLTSIVRCLGLVDMAGGLEGITAVGKKGCGNLPQGCYPLSNRASADSLHSGRLCEAAVRGATGLGFSNLARPQLTSGDFHRQGNPSEARPVSQQQAHRVQFGLLCVPWVTGCRAWYWTCKVRNPHWWWTRLCPVSNWLQSVISGRVQCLTHRERFNCCHPTMHGTAAVQLQHACLRVC
jgi:hypothetical protein